MPRKTAKKPAVKSAKKASARQTSVKTPKVETSILDIADVVKASTKKLSFGLTKPQKIILIAIIAAGLLVYLVKDLFVVAMVNGKPISRLAVIRELESRGGKQTLDSLVTQTLILQEAEKNSISVNDEEVEGEISKIKSDLEKQGQNLEQALSSQGMTEEDLRKQVKVQKTVEKILGDKVQVTDEEVDSYIQTSGFYEEGQEATNEEKGQAKEQLKQQKLSQEFNNWLTQVKSEANITYFLEY